MGCPRVREEVATDQVVATLRHDMLMYNAHMLGLKSDCTEELRMPGCVWIDNRHEHTAEVVPATFHTVFLPKLSEGRLGVGWVAGNLFSNTKWMIGGHHLLEEVVRRRREMLGSGLSVQALAGI